MTRRIPSISEVAAAYRPKFREELAGDWASVVFYRPVSFVLTPLFVACSISPTGVTFLALACAIALPWLALPGGTSAAFLVGAMGVLWCVLDCVDGNVARVTGRVSRRGAYADFLSDTLYRVAMYTAIGLLVDAVSAGGTTGRPFALGANAGLALALGCALLSIIARACRLYVQHSVDVPASVAAAPLRFSDGSIFGFLSGLDRLLPIAVLVLGATDHLAWLLAYLAAYSLGDFLIAQMTALARLR